jgi:nucleotide-binding universal stress UspA family protein
METNRNVIIALDTSDASVRAVRYVADTLGLRKDLRVYLLHVLPPIPPELLEFGGSENPQKEEDLTKELRREQSEWVARAKQEVGPIFDRVKTILGKAGVSPDVVHREFSTSIHRPDVARDVLEAAHKWKCSTVVAGRHSFPWLKEHLGHHVGEDLIRKGQGFAIWIIE